jgi:hypothetical protein
MKHVLPLTVILCLIWLGALPAPAGAVSTTATYTGGGWTLILTFRHATYGQIMSGKFHSAHRTFPVYGDWIPAADEGSDLLRFYGHPYGPKSPLGLVGLATLFNTCTPSCVASNHFKLVETSVSPQLSAKLPGVDKRSLLLRLHT